MTINALNPALYYLSISTGKDLIAHFLIDAGFSPLSKYFYWKRPYCSFPNRCWPSVVNPALYLSISTRIDLIANFLTDAGLL